MSNDELYTKTECYSMATEVKLGHVVRMKQEKDSQEGLKLESSRHKETWKAKNYPEKNI